MLRRRKRSYRLAIAGTANEAAFFNVEGLAFPGAQSVAVQNGSDFAVAMLIERPVDGRGLSVGDSRCRT